ncbi:carbohydrate kinase family protein [Pelagimonas varians]|uniref:2-dehydro-3-deoxygluconokinase n=1 Tax=Pelagimonas varians TaxID=696760 RepID=A0A238KWJ7_9RHOB|nr:carbohydrate kinase [Pelagimonas varians]PYG27972.1 fructokinase [Pelagimonas varians]SMX47183.1 2-dehydro-3-deoxygluconokinase [Pelagimonas varians]
MIVCCGEALIDMIPQADPNGGQSLKPHAGGAVFNTAIALGRLGVSSYFLSGVSTDMFGKMLLQELHGSRVDTGLVIRSDRPTTLAFVELTDGHASYVFYDENTAGRMLDPNELPEIPQVAQAMYFGGISLINEPAADFYLALALRESKRRVIVADPNIRANFVTDEARYRARLNQLIACVDILKVSDEDLDWIVPGPLTQIEKADVLRERGPKVIVLTRGGDGACAFFGNDLMVEVPVEKVEVADTVGAGDTFNAGFLASLSQNGLLAKTSIETLLPADLKAALELGAKVAAITVSRPGANPPWHRELS